MGRNPATIAVASFGDGKLLKGKEAYCKRTRRNVITGEVPASNVPSDWRNTYCITGYTSINRSNAPLYWTIHQEKNDSSTFRESIIRAISRGFLKVGDILILDNAAIHNGGTNRNIDQQLWEEAGIALGFLPPRAPELNPIELVWAALVHKLRAMDLNVLKARGGTHVVAEAAHHALDSFTHEGY